MIRLYTLFLLIIPISFTFGQDSDPTIDSLKQLLANQQSDSIKVNTLIELGTNYLYANNIDEALRFANQGQSLAFGLGYKKGLGYAYKLSGQCFSTRSNYLEAMEKFKLSLTAFEEIDFKEGISNILSNIGSVYFLLGDDTKAIENHLQSLKVAEEMGNKSRIATALNNLGSVYANKSATTDKAIAYFRRALPLFEEINYPDGIGIVSHNIGENYFKKHAYDSALMFLETAIKIYEGTSDAAISLSYVGEIYAERNDYELALDYHNRAVELSERLDVKLDLAQSLLSLAKTQQKKGDFSKSIQTYQRALTISEEIKARQEIRVAYGALAQLYAKQGDFKNAYTFESLFTAIKDTLYNTDEDKKVQQLQFNFDISKKENEISLLTKDKELQEATIQRQKIVNYAAAIVGVLLIVMVSGIYSRYKYVRKTNKIIQDERDRSKELLLNILPEETAHELETNGHAQTRFYENVTVLFTDFKGFSTIAGKLSPQELVSELNDYFMAFDDIVDRYNLEKIKTIGDAYMCAGGIPAVNDTHPINAVQAALAMQEFMKRKNEERSLKGEQGWELRIGIHTGPIVAGVVGKMKYAYDIWGDTVNIASRMESNGEAGKVNISATTYEQIKNQYECQYRGKISAKNIGEVDMYFIENEINEVESTV